MWSVNNSVKITKKCHHHRPSVFFFRTISILLYCFPLFARSVHRDILLFANLRFSNRHHNDVKKMHNARVLVVCPTFCCKTFQAIRGIALLLHTIADLATLVFIRWSKKKSYTISLPSSSVFDYTITTYYTTIFLRHAMRKDDSFTFHIAFYICAVNSI